MKIFVIMPFNEELKHVYEQLIKAPLIKAGHEVSRADDLITHDHIPSGIIKNIRDSDVIIADLTGQNANVYYELGIAHTINQPTVRIVQDYDELTFYMKPYNAIKYSTDMLEAAEFTGDIVDIIERAGRGEVSFSNPVSLSLEHNHGRKVLALPSSIGNTDGLKRTDGDVLGLLNSFYLAEVALDEIRAILMEVHDLILKPVQENMLSELRQIASNSNVKQLSLNAIRLQVARQLATYLNNFSDPISALPSRVDAAWIQLDQGVAYLLSGSGYYQQTYEKRCARIASFIGFSRVVRECMRSQIRLFQCSRSILEDCYGLSDALDQALHNSDRALEDLSDVFKFGDSLIAKYIRLAADVSDRLAAENPENRVAQK